MTEFLARHAWADSSWSRGGSQLTGSKLRGTANHWPGTTTSAYGVESRSAVRSKIRGWWRYHVLIRGWSDIGYNVAFDQAGRVWDLRGLGRVGAHAASSSNPDANHEWVGCLFIVGANEKPTPALIAAYQEWYHRVFLPRWPGRNDMTGHGRAPGVPGAQTSCPGPEVARVTSSGILKQRPTDQEVDDMPAPKDWDAEDGKALREFLHGENHYAGKRVVAHSGGKNEDYHLRRIQTLVTGQAKILAVLAEGQMDPEGLAQAIAGFLVPAVIEELGDAVPPEVVEAASENAVRRVMGSVDDATEAR